MLYKWKSDIFLENANGNLCFWGAGGGFVFFILFLGFLFRLRRVIETREIEEKWRLGGGVASIYGNGTTERECK